MLNRTIMALLYPILYVDIFRQSSYKNSVLIGMMHRQLTYFSKKYSKINRITLSGKNRLSEVCEKDNIKIVKYVGKKINLIEQNKFMFMNNEYNNVKIVRYVVNCGYNINYKISTCKSMFYYDNLLSLNAKLGHTKLLLLLLKKGANINIVYERAIVLSAENGHIDVVKLLLKKGVQMNEHNSTALAYSAQNGHIKIIKLLLDNGADIHVNHEYALTLSALCGQTEVIKLLLKNGANVHANNNFILWRSAFYGKVEVVKLLLDHGANIHRLDLHSVHPDIKKIIEEKLQQ